MVSHTQYKKKVGQFQKKKLPINISNSLFPSKHVQRKFPIQAAFHVVLDGALVGVLISVVIMSSIALHSQYLWTRSFTKLETIRDLNRRIMESTSILEGYLLKNQKLSKYLVPTKAEDLIYVDSPPSFKNNGFLVDKTLTRKLLERISSFPIKSGY